MTRPTQALLRHPRPYADEDLAGYILRICQSNGYDSPQWTYTLAGIPQYTANGNFFDRTTRDLSQLALLFSIEESKLWTMAFCGHKPSELIRVELFGRSLPTYNLQKQRAKVCPCCLVAEPYCRKL